MREEIMMSGTPEEQRWEFESRDSDRPQRNGLGPTRKGGGNISRYVVDSRIVDPSSYLSVTEESVHVEPVRAPRTTVTLVRTLELHATEDRLLANAVRRPRYQGPNSRSG